ncbi:baseplate J/gp47 family protein [Paenibacillus thermotolerans]|uniref:baseplate J/gp47 family protein n=1 Tax=Paenibacillus thermotolerans TaxID=3027807 RepID=UPI0023684874|nr:MULTISPECIES: baseplate J/gp47 family protein [unclassified Paenibacillus]
MVTTTFDDDDKERILNEMLDSVPDTYDKRAGSPIYDSLAPPAEQFAKTDAKIEEVKKKLSIDELTGDELARRVKERTGIDRRAATNAVGEVMLTGTGPIQIGDLFETSNGIQFQATEVKNIVANGTVKIEALVAGPNGNVPAGTITLFPVTIAGFTAVSNPSPTTDGFAAESDADLLQRYYDRIRTPATSGNKSHYLNWAKEVGGVGAARVLPLWNGDNTVKVVIIDANRLPASVQLVEDVQDYIDPGAAGLGEGAAPIGAFVTVTSAAGLNINIVVSIVLSSGYTLEQADSNISAGLTAYLQGIAFVENVVSYAKIGAAILSSEGVEDYSGLTVNGGTVNIPVGTEQVAVLGSVNVNVA